MVSKNRQGRHNEKPMHSGWYLALQDELQKPYFLELKKFVAEEAKRTVVYPKEDQVFRALKETPLDSVKIVIMGQDPYHGENQAEGLSFSVPKECPIPPSLRNIFRELQSDLGVETPHHGHLSTWAHQGVLLLNATLTVEAGRAKSHYGKGWETFTDAVIRILIQQDRPMVFLLWGRSAIDKYRFVQAGNNPKHLVLTSPHPSPLSAYNGFFGSRPFSKINTFLKEHGMKEIDWRIR